jgi:hypothetical protein
VQSVQARVTVTRNLPADIQQRQVYVSLDGAPLATLVYGQSVTRPIPPGPHHIRAHNTLVWKTLEFDAQPGEDVQFVLANRPGRWLLSALALFGVGPLFLTFERRPGDAVATGSGRMQRSDPSSINPS